MASCTLLIVGNNMNEKANQLWLLIISVAIIMEQLLHVK